jgi:hypothetical protein
VTHEFRQALAQPILHREPQSVVDALLVSYGKTHQKVVAHEIGLLQWRALKVEAFEDQVGIVSFTQVYHDDHLFHQKEPRVKAHVLVAFLGYALWVTPKHLLQRRAAIVPQPLASGVFQAPPFSPMKALALLSTLQSADQLELDCRI